MVSPLRGVLSLLTPADFQKLPLAERVARTEALSSSGPWTQSNAFRRAPTEEEQRLAQALADGEIDYSTYLVRYNELNPPTMFDAPATPPPLQDIYPAVGKKAASKGVLGLTVRPPDGERVSSRLDIPAYNAFGPDYFIETLHKPKGGPQGYGQGLMMRNVEMNTFPDRALEIATGNANKSPFAMMEGDYVAVPMDEMRDRMATERGLVQVGMNPTRSGAFYDKATGRPLAGADEVMQVGADVRARNPVYRDADDPALVTRGGRNTPAGVNFGGGRLAVGGTAVGAGLLAASQESEASPLRGVLSMARADRMKRAREMGMNTRAYSGSTHDIKAFRGALANPEGDWGRGSYATTSAVDASENYAGVGPDLTGRIQRRAEQLADELMHASDDEIEMALEDVGLTLGDFEADEAGAVEAIARSELVGDAGEGVVYPLRIRTDNYAVIGGPDETYLRESRDYIEDARRAADDPLDEDEVYELADQFRNDDPDSLIGRVSKAVRDTDLYQDEGAIESILTDVLDRSLDGELSVADLDAAVRSHAVETYSDEGELLSAGEISRQTLQNLGFEGVIDNTVDAKFGSSRRGFGGARIPGMTGVGPDTQHIVTFPGAEQNIRSEFATFDPAKRDSSNLSAGVGGAAVGAGLLAAPQESEAAPFGTLASQIGKRTREAFHGSPHIYDQVDLSRMGSGEGAQAYGAGYYAADARDVAEQYRQATMIANTAREWPLPEDAEFDEVLEAIDEGEIDGSVAELMRALDRDDWLGFDFPSQAFSAALRPGASSRYDMSAELKQLVDSAGALYRLEIPDEDLLDWDAPLSEQPEAVREAVLDAAFVRPEQRDEMARRLTGREAHELMRDDYGSREEVAQALRGRGVLGVRYLDGASRNAGEGTRNYVIFDDSNVNVVERNGAPVAAMPRGRGYARPGMMAAAGVLSGALNEGIGLAENLGALAYNTGVQSASGLAGLLAGADAVPAVQDYLGYVPQSQAAQRQLGVLADTLGNLGDAVMSAADKLPGDIRGSDYIRYAPGYWRDRVVPALQSQLGDRKGSALAAFLRALPEAI